MNWQPLISRWRVEADRRQQQMDAGRGDQTIQWATEQAAVISTLRKCAEQAEKSHKRQQLRECNPCCGDCGFEHLQQAAGHPLYCGRCGAAWDGSELMRYPSGRMGPSSWKWRCLDMEQRTGPSGVTGEQYSEWLAMVVSG